MDHTWRMLIWNGKRYTEANPVTGEAGTTEGFVARSPKHALKLGGLDDEAVYTARYSRRGYGYYTGRIYVKLPETVAAGEHQPADFILEVIKH